MQRPLRSCGSCRAWPGFFVQTSPWISSENRPRRNRIPELQPRCRKPNASCSLACITSAAHEENREGCGNEGLWKARKTKPRFPSLPTALGNRCRDSHIPTAPTRRGKVENERHVSHFPACCLISTKNNQKGGPCGGSLRSRLQAHSSMRKCYRKCVVR